MGFLSRSAFRVTKGADILGVRRATLSDLINGKAALTAEMALRIHKAFGPDVGHLMRMQVAYEVAQIAKAREGDQGQALCRQGGADCTDDSRHRDRYVPGLSRRPNKSRSSATKNERPD